LAGEGGNSLGIKNTVYALCETGIPFKNTCKIPSLKIISPMDKSGYPKLAM